MGVPKFFTWLSERYPCILVPLTESSLPSFDNLYLDMNGIIHACTHSNEDDKNGPKKKMSDEDIFMKIFQYIEKLFNLIKPKKYFFMGVDGVAPRAKMNQQRSRRFRSAKDAEEARKKAIENGEDVPDIEDVFDSNCITPGTEFMEKLDENLKFFIKKKLQEDVEWQKCKVIYSGHQIPGEGEHKIMQVIRGRKCQKGYDANETHCMYGLDADLIMLSLMSHEPNFVLLREELIFDRGQNKKKQVQLTKKDNFQLIYISLIREYLDLECQNVKNEISFTYDLEKIIDDYILMCFFCGNDFIPHSPTLDIREGAIPLMLTIYKQILPKLGGYFIENGKLNYERIGLFLSEISKGEEEIMDKRLSQKIEIERKLKKYSKKKKQVIEVLEFEDEEEISPKEETPQNEQDLIFDILNPRKENITDLIDQQEMLLNSDIENGFKQDLQIPDLDTSPSKTLNDVLGLKSEKKVKDDILLECSKKGELGLDFDLWRREYYKRKFKVDVDDKEKMNEILFHYTEAITWVYQYYFKGCSSWSWFYPYHYAPLASDLVEIGKLNDKIKFELGKPFEPFQQLLSVLPSRSSHMLPKEYQSLMLSSNSKLLEYYPLDFPIDKEGTKYEYEGVVILPFINEQLLIDEMNKIELNEKDKKRNEILNTLIFSFDLKENSIVKSTIPKYISNIENCHVIQKIFKIPSEKGFKPILLENTKIGKETPENFPTFSLFPIKVEEKVIGINLFGYSSKKLSLLLNLIEEEDLKMEAKDFKHLIGNTIFIGYPYSRQVLVSSICDINQTYYNNNKFENHKKNEKDEFLNEIKFHKKVLLSRYGIHIENIQVLFYVKLFKEMKKNQNGSITKVYFEKEFAFPSNLIAPKDYNPIRDDKFKQISSSPSLKLSYKLNQKLISLNEKYYGRLSSIIDFDLKNKKLKLKFEPIKFNQNDLLKNEIKSKIKNYKNEKYFNTYQISQKVNLDPKLLGLITGSLFVFDLHGKKRDIGLKLKNNSQNKKLLGFTKRKDTSSGGGSTGNTISNDETEKSYFLNDSKEKRMNSNLNKFNQSSSTSNQSSPWLFSKKAMNLIINYVNEFKNVFNNLNDILSNSKKIKIEITDLFDDEEKDHEKKIGEILKYLKSLEHFNEELIDCQTDLLPLDIINQIENNILKKEEKEEEKEKEYEIDILDPFLCYKPPDPFPFSYNYLNDFNLGDIVINISGTGSIPFGMIGIIVSLLNDHVEIIFNEEFIGGTKLNGKLKSNLGQLSHVKSLLNLSNPKYRYPKKSTNSSTKQKSIVKNQWKVEEEKEGNSYLNQYQSKAQQILFPFKIEQNLKTPNDLKTSTEIEKELAKLNLNQDSTIKSSIVNSTNHWDPSETFKKIHKDNKKKFNNKSKKNDKKGDIKKDDNTTLQSKKNDNTSSQSKKGDESTVKKKFDSKKKNEKKIKNEEKTVKILINKERNKE
eukprot:gene2441-3152_t